DLRSPPAPDDRPVVTANGRVFSEGRGAGGAWEFLSGDRVPGRARGASLSVPGLGRKQNPDGVPTRSCTARFFRAARVSARTTGPRAHARGSGNNVCHAATAGLHPRTGWLPVPGVKAHLRRGEERKTAGPGGALARARPVLSRSQAYGKEISTISKRSVPRGTWISTTSPGFLPSRPWPMGLVVRILFSW